MRIKTSELEGAALDFCVAKSLGKDVENRLLYIPSINWLFCGQYSQARVEVQQEADDSYAYYDGDNVMHIVASPIDDNENSSSYNLGKFFYLSPAEQQVLAESSGMALAALATIVAYSWLAFLA